MLKLHKLHNLQLQLRKVEDFDGFKLLQSIKYYAQNKQSWMKSIKIRIEVI